MCRIFTPQLKTTHMKKGQTRSFSYPYFASELWDIYLRYKKANKQVRKRMLEMYGYTNEKNFIKYVSGGLGK